LVTMRSVDVLVPAFWLASSVPLAMGIEMRSSNPSAATIRRCVCVLPNAAPATGGQFTYSNYVLLRESDTRYWLFRVGDQYAYAIAKSEVLYIRY